MQSTDLLSVLCVCRYMYSYRIRIIKRDPDRRGITGIRTRKIRSLASSPREEDTRTRKRTLPDGRGARTVFSADGYAAPTNDASTLDSYVLFILFIQKIFLEVHTIRLSVTPVRSAHGQRDSKISSKTHFYHEQ